jgi:hypothetical protein
MPYSQPMSRDPAEWNESSHTPDMTALDTAEDRLTEDAAAFYKTQGVPPNRKALAQMTARFALSVLNGKDQRNNTKQAQEMGARILATIIDSGQDARLVAQCIDFATGMNVQGSITEQMIADQHGLTRAAVSKRCIQLCEEFAIPPSAGMRSQKTRAKYRQRQRGRRTVLVKDKWPFQGLLTTLLHDSEQRFLSRGNFAKAPRSRSRRGRGNGTCGASD